MPLDGHSFLLSQGWSGHGTGLRQDSIVRPLAIPQKRTLAGLGKDRDEAFPFWDHVFSVAAKSIQVKLYKDDDDDSDTEATPREASLDLTTTGILSNKPPKLGSSAIATIASSSSTSGINTPTIAIIPNSRASSSSNLLVAAKKESAKRNLYSRFFRGPILGLDSDSSDCCSDDSSSLDSNAMFETRTGDEVSGWNSNLNGGVKSGSRTPMAIAKSKLTSASEVVIPLKKGKGGEEQTKVKKRKRSDDDEVEVKQQEMGREDGRRKVKKEKKKGKEEKQEKKEKKKRKRDEKKSLKEEKKRENKFKKDKTTKTATADKLSSLESLLPNKHQEQTVEINEASTDLDKNQSIPSCEDEDIQNDKGKKKRERERKGKDSRPDMPEDKEKKRQERKRKRDRKEAEKKAAAVAPQVIDADGERFDASDTKSVYSPVENGEDFRSESKKKKKRKRDE